MQVNNQTNDVHFLNRAVVQNVKTPPELHFCLAFLKTFVVVVTTTTTMNRLLLISAAVLLTAAPAIALVTPVVTADAAAVSSALTSGQDISSLTKSLKTVFTSEEIDKILPHRYPFALVDKVVEYTAGKSAVGIKCVTKVRPFCWSPLRRIRGYVRIFLGGSKSQRNLVF
jgi:hypothetical protein